MLGSSYVIDHVIAENNIRVREVNYRTYMSDVLMGVARYIGIDVPYRLVELEANEEEEEVSGDEIALEVIRRAGLKGKINGD